MHSEEEVAIEVLSVPVREIVDTAIQQESGSLATRVQYVPMAGGLSGAAIWRCQLGKRAYCLRRWPRQGMTVRRLAWLHMQLQRTGEKLNYISVPLKLIKERTWLAFPSKQGGTQDDPQELWELSPWLPGEPLSPRSPVDHQKLAVESLAELHAVLAVGQTNRNVSPAIQKRRERLEATSCKDVATKLAKLGFSSADASALEQMLSEKHRVANRLLEPWHDRPVNCQPVQIDSRPEHFLFSCNEQKQATLTGLIDFGAMAVDLPAVDVARLVSELAVGDPVKLSALVDHYNLVAAEPVDSELIKSLDLSGAVLGILNWLDWVETSLTTPQVAMPRIITLAERLGFIVSG